MMASCREISARLSASLDCPLSTRERIGLRLHLMLCNGCRAFARQLRLLGGGMRLPESDGEAGGTAPEARLPDDARERILARLHDPDAHTGPS